MSKFLPPILIMCALALAVVGVSRSIGDVFYDRQVTAFAKQAVAQANAGRPSPAPSTIKPSANTVTNYIVAANQPRYIMIPKLHVQARILSVGLTKSDAIGTPNNVYDTAWYNASSLPGQPGAMVIDGHVSSWTTRGVFYGLDSLSNGDLVQVQRGDGKIFTYEVMKIQIYNVNVVDIQSLLESIVSTAPGLNLITCTGDVIAGKNNFSERIIVYTKQV